MTQKQMIDWSLRFKKSCPVPYVRCWPLTIVVNYMRLKYLITGHF